jgi:hypothetical protein
MKTVSGGPARCQSVILAPFGGRRRRKTPNLSPWRAKEKSSSRVRFISRLDGGDRQERLCGGHLHDGRVDVATRNELGADLDRT